MEKGFEKGLVDGSDASLEGFSFKDKLKKLAFLFIEKTYFKKMDGHWSLFFFSFFNLLAIHIFKRFV